LREEPALDVRSITVNADRGTVTLEGTVRTVGEKTRAEQAALQVAGVLTVVNRLQVEDFGTARDELTPDVMGRVD
jgi:osmotically-inducible protein OsmY